MEVKEGAPKQVKGVYEIQNLYEDHLTGQFSLRVAKFP